MLAQTVAMNQQNGPENRQLILSPYARILLPDIYGNHNMQNGICGIRLFKWVQLHLHAEFPLHPLKATVTKINISRYATKASAEA